MQEPIVNLPLLYVNGCNLSRPSATTLSLSAGICRDSTNTFDLNIGNYLGLSGVGTANSATTINAAVNGLNGLDTGSLGASSDYYVFVIASSVGYYPTGAILSLSATAPKLPFGYDLFRRVGAVLTDGGSSLWPFFQTGNGSEKNYQFDNTITVVNNLGNTTPQTLSLTPSVPPGANSARVLLYAILTPNTAGNSFLLQPTGAITIPINISAPVVSQANKIAPFMFTPAKVAGNYSINWATTSASDVLNLNVYGYTDSL